jgi:drug/metabolite transporter (DMT)-like permease
LQPASKAKGYFALLITSIVWGTTWVVSKVGVSEMPALQMASIRQLIAGTLFVSFFLFVKKIALPTARQFRWLFVMAILMFVSANGLSTWSIKFIPAGLSALIGALYPLCVVIIEKIFYKSKKLTALTFVGLFLGIAGIAIVFYEHAFHHSNSDFLFGVLLSAIAMLSWSVGTIFIAGNKVDINPYYGLGWQMLIGGILLFLSTTISGHNIPFAMISTKVWLVITYLVTLGSVIAFVAFIYSMKKLSAPVAALYAYVNPLVAMITANLFLHEKLSMNILWGSIVTLAGVFLVNYSIKKSGPVIEPEL